MIPAGIGHSWQDGAVRKVIEWSAHEGLASAAERHNSISGWDELTC
jgi:hypothetical protein